MFYKLSILPLVQKSGFKNNFLDMKYQEEMRHLFTRKTNGGRIFQSPFLTQHLPLPKGITEVGESESSCNLVSLLLPRGTGADRLEAEELEAG